MSRIWPGEIEALSQRLETRVYVLRADRYDPDFPNMTSLLDFAAWLGGVIESIPEAYRPGAKIEIDSKSGYEGDHDPRIEISYRRPETDEEWAARRLDVQRRLAANEAQERAAYERLKAKFT